MHFTPTNILRLVVSTAILGCLVLFVASTALSDDKAASQDKIKELKKQRLSQLEEIVKLENAMYAAGTGQLGDLWKAEQDVLAARLDLAETKEARIKILEEGVKHAEKMASLVEGRFKTGQVVVAEHLKAKVYVLDAQIALETAKAEK